MAPPFTRALAALLLAARANGACAPTAGSYCSASDTLLLCAAGFWGDAAAGPVSRASLMKRFEAPYKEFVKRAGPPAWKA